MSLIEWSPTFEIGQETIDTHHKHIVDLINILDIHLERELEVDNLTVLASLDALTEYTIYHFTFEEALMKERELPSEKWANHTSEHNLFRERIGSYRARLLTESYKIIAYNLRVYLKTWLITHILTVDKACF